MGILNHREISLIIWAIIAFVISLSKEKLRKSYKDIIKIFFSIKLIIPILIEYIYLIYIVYLLKKYNLWNFELIKETIVFALISSVILTNKIITSKDDNPYFKHVIKANLTISIFIEFLYNVHVFPLIVEFILTPLTFFLIMLIAVAERDEKNKKVYTILHIILSVFIAYLLIKSIIDVINLLSIKYAITSSKSILVAPILSILLIPIIYILDIFSKYEILILFIKRNKNLITKDKLRIFLIMLSIAGFSVKRLKTIMYSNIYHPMLIKERRDIYNMKSYHKYNNEKSRIKREMEESKLLLSMIVEVLSGIASFVLIVNILKIINIENVFINRISIILIITIMNIIIIYLDKGKNTGIIKQIFRCIIFYTFFYIGNILTDNGKQNDIFTNNNLIIICTILCRILLNILFKEIYIINKIKYYRLSLDIQISSTLIKNVSEALVSELKEVKNQLKNEYLININNIRIFENFNLDKNEVKLEIWGMEVKNCKISNDDFYS